MDPENGHFEELLCRADPWCHEGRITVWVAHRIYTFCPDLHQVHNSATF